MGLIGTLNTWNPGDTIVDSELEANWDAIKTVVNTYALLTDVARTVTVKYTFNAAAPLNFNAWAQGGIGYLDASKDLVQLAIGGANAVLVSNGTVPSWSTTPTIPTLTLTNALLTTSGGTGLNSYTAGDLLYYSASTLLSKLAIGGANTVLASTGSAPNWVSSLTLAGLTMSGQLSCADQLVVAPVFKDYALERQAKGNISGAVTIDITAGNYVTATLTGNMTAALTLQNPTASGDVCTVTLRLTNGGAFTYTHPTGTVHPSGVAPTLTSSGTDILIYHTDDGGTTWYCTLFGADFS